MYEQFRNELTAKLSDTLTTDQLLSVLSAVDQLSVTYDIAPKATGSSCAQTDLPEMVKVYLVARSTEGLSKGTIKGYSHMLRRFFRDVDKAPEHVSTNDIRVWMSSYQSARRIGNETLESYRVSLNSFFTWAVEEEYLTKNPFKRIKPIKFEKRQRHAMTQIELEYIRRACRTPKETALVEFLYSTGCRISEVAGATLQDVDLHTNEVTVIGKGSKQRTCYLNAKAVVALRAYLDTRTDDSAAIFVTDRAPHNPIGKPGLEKIIKQICSRTEAIGVRVTPHVFRHTTATVALQNGMPVQDVQRMLGHSNIATTMIYAETSQR